MYRLVPIRRVALYKSGRTWSHSLSSFAKPKSKILTIPNGSMPIFSGFKSRNKMLKVKDDGHLLSNVSLRLSYNNVWRRTYFFSCMYFIPAVASYKIDILVPIERCIDCFTCVLGKPQKKRESFCLCHLPIASLKVYSRRSMTRK